MCFGVVLPAVAGDDRMPRIFGEGDWMDGITGGVWPNAADRALGEGKDGAAAEGRTVGEGRTADFVGEGERTELSGEPNPADTGRCLAGLWCDDSFFSHSAIRF